MNDTAPKMFKWGDQEIDPARISTANLFALAQQGINHKYGNEVSAARVAWLKSEEGKNADEDEVAKWVADRRAAMLDKILNGELGVRTVGAPRVSGIEALKRTIAVEILRKRLDAESKRTGNKVTLPKGEATIEVRGKHMTREQLIEAMLRSNAQHIEQEARRRQEAQEEGSHAGEDLFAAE